MAASPLVIQKPEEHKGRSSTSVFGNDRPVRLEIGMGMGRFIRDLSEREPKINFIGFEINTTVLYKALKRYEARLSERGIYGGEGAKALQKEDPDHDVNLRFIRSDARFLSDYFAEGEIERIYLNFSDPWPKDKNANKRLTSPIFLDLYKKTLIKDGLIEFKTDNEALFEYSLLTFPEAGYELVAVSRDLHNDSELSEGNIMTEYEAKFSEKGNPIFKLVARLPR